ncbi:hypothetical protein D3C80_1102870 [compost metagenome]
MKPADPSPVVLIPGKVVATLNMSRSPNTKGMFFIPSISIVVTPEMVVLVISFFFPFTMTSSSEFMFSAIRKSRFPLLYIMMFFVVFL